MRELTLQEIKQLELDILRTLASICERHNLRYYLFGGTLLGAVRHQGFIPWDDDVDIAMPRKDLESLEEICRTELPEPYAFFSWKDDWRMGHNVRKIYDTRTVWIEEARPDCRVEIGVFVDIWPMDGAPKGMIRKRIHGAWIIAHRLMLRATAFDSQDRNKPWTKRLLARIWQAIANERVIKWIHANLDVLSRKYSFDESDEWASYLDYRGPRDYMPKSWVGDGATVTFEGYQFATFAGWHKYLELTYGDYMTPPPPALQTTHHRYQAWWRE